MAKTLLSMRQIKEVLRLKHEQGRSVRQVARSCGLPRSTVQDYVQRAEGAGLSWPLPAELTEEQLWERLLAVNPPPTASAPAKPVPEWPKVHSELERPGMTLRLLWEEYRRTHPTGYGYSRFCELYQGWAGTLEPVLRQVHEPGAKLFVDWAGQTMPIHLADGRVIAASVFVAALGASHKLYVEAFADQKVASWIAGHVHAFAFYEGVSRAVVPDNTKTAVVRPCRYEPTLHRSYQEMATHYGTVILPARVVHPRDKAKVETGVQIAQRRILAPLRDIRFFSVAELNQALRERLTQVNAEPFQKLEGSRNTWFETREKAQLLPLPAQPYELACYLQATVNIDYHVAVDRHFYSVPYALIHQTVEVRLTRTTVEIFHRHQRVAAHARSDRRGQFTTVAEHRPQAHQKYLEWTPQRLAEWASKTGPQCARLVRGILERRPHPEQGYRACLGLLRLGKQVGAERLEAACCRALHFGIYSYSSVKTMLEKGLDRQPLEVTEAPSPAHDNVRGADYYQ
jgi:transposase